MNYIRYFTTILDGRLMMQVEQMGLNGYEHRRFLNQFSLANSTVTFQIKGPRKTQLAGDCRVCGSKDPEDGLACWI